MKIEKLPSGSYRVRKQINGKRVTKIFDHEPKKKELEQAFAEMILENNRSYNLESFETAARKYIDTKSHVLSPSTLGEYSLKINRLSEEFRNLKVDDISKFDIQKEINEMYKRKLSPKTVADMNGFIQAVLKLFQSDYKYYAITLPQRKKNTVYIPTNDDIKRIIELSEGTKYNLAIKLGCFGLRRSEICCLSKSDLEGNVLHINKAYVQNKYTKEWYVKSTKTTMSERDIIIPAELAKQIMESDCIYDGYPNSISNWLRKVQDKEGMEHFSLHKERHFFATQLMEMGCNQKDIQALGGWSTDHVLKNIYQHERISKDREKQLMISAALLNTIS